MPSRREVKQQVSAMQSDIRRMALDATSSSQMLPSVRELAQKYGISFSLVAQSLRALAEENVIYSIPRIGSFVSRLQDPSDDTYLMLVHLPKQNIHCATVQVGFEERIAQLGGECLTLERESARQWYESGKLRNVAGVFYFDEADRWPDIWTFPHLETPTAKFGEMPAALPETKIDNVYFDNLKGGQQATQHLLDAGHSRIAFLGLHGKRDEAGIFLWSEQRAAGWRMAMGNAGHSTQGLCFRPDKTPVITLKVQVRVARQTSVTLLQNQQITAVVATNHLAAQGLFQALHEANVPGEKWPAVVCFDTENIDGKDSAAHVTSLRLPWEDIGRSAADLLWERNHGKANEQPHQRLVPMRLIRRMTSRRSWAQSALHTSSAALFALGCNS